MATEEIETSTETEKSSQFRGVVVPNDQVASFHRKHGAPSFSKPHGAAKTILYYHDPEAAKEEAGEFKDFAGEETPTTKDLILQGDSRGSINVSRTIRAGHAPRRVTIDGNPNRAVAGAEIEGQLDEEVTKLEEDYMKKRLEQGPEVMGLPALSLGEKVLKVEQEPINETVDVQLPTDPPEGEKPVIGPDVGRKGALGDEGGGGGQQAKPKDDEAQDDQLWEG